MEYHGHNVAFIVAVVIGLINTSIQLAWNDKREDVFDWVLWGASYVVGITSNYFGLMALFNIGGDPMIQKAFSWGLGSMLEIAPEKLFVKGLRMINFKFSWNAVFAMLGMGSKKSSNNNQPKPQYNNQSQNQNRQKSQNSANPRWQNNQSQSQAPREDTYPRQTPRDLNNTATVFARTRTASPTLPLVV